LVWGGGRQWRAVTAVVVVVVVVVAVVVAVGVYWRIALFGTVERRVVDYYLGQVAKSE